MLLPPDKCNSLWTYGSSIYCDVFITFWLSFIARLFPQDSPSLALGDSCWGRSRVELFKLCLALLFQNLLCRSRAGRTVRAHTTVVLRRWLVQRTPFLPSPQRLFLPLFSSPKDCGSLLLLPLCSGRLLEFALGGGSVLVIPVSSYFRPVIPSHFISSFKLYQL